MLFKILLFVYLGLLVIMNIFTFGLFLKDKKMAQKNGNEVRVKEKTLLSCTAFGGAIGAFIGRLVAHHKTNKIYFSMTIYFSLLVQLAVLAALIYVAFIMGV